MKSSLFRCCLAVLAFAGLNVLASPLSQAQDGSETGGGTVSGIVTDDQGPVIGAAVMIKDSQGGVTTGMDGEYSLSGLEQGDVIAMLDAGAYGWVMASTYNQRTRPAEVLIGADGRARLIRRRETLEDLTALFVTEPEE